MRRCAVVGRDRKKNNHGGTPLFLLCRLSSPRSQTDLSAWIWPSGRFRVGRVSAAERSMFRSFFRRARKKKKRKLHLSLRADDNRSFTPSKNEKKRASVRHLRGELLEYYYFLERGITLTTGKRCCRILDVFASLVRPGGEINNNRAARYCYARMQVRERGLSMWDKFWNGGGRERKVPPFKGNRREKEKRGKAGGAVGVGGWGGGGNWETCGLGVGAGGDRGQGLGYLFVP